jgi:hypothetical protein
MLTVKRLPWDATNVHYLPRQVADDDKGRSTLFAAAETNSKVIASGYPHHGHL